MLQFLLSCVFLTSILLWWAESRFNYFYAIVDAMKKCCAWIKNQTKFKIDVCKWFLPILLIVGAIVYLYYPYFKDTLDFKDGAVVIRDYPKESQQKELVLNQVTKNLDSEEKTNPIGDWGTFGDFIGGTLNPLIGFISILLLFATWKLTRKTLDFTREELKNSNEILNIQQFDAIFWGLLGHLKKIEELLYQKDNDHNLILDSVYHQIFLYRLDDSLSEKRQKILRNAEVSQYFIVLYQILKNIDEKIGTDNLRLKKSYSNILRANISTKILQLLAVNCYEDFPEYKNYLERFNFLEHMPFYFIMDHRLVNVKLLECLAVYDQKVFDRSIYFKEYLNDRALKLFFEENPKNIDSYLGFLLSGLVGENEIKLEVDLAHNQSRRFDLIIEIEEGNSVFIYPKNKKTFTGF